MMKPLLGVSQEANTATQTCPSKSMGCVSIQHPEILNVLRLHLAISQNSFYTHPAVVEAAVVSYVRLCP
jgi:hypothetical protein